jgi:hypothetical protein
VNACEHVEPQLIPVGLRDGASATGKPDRQRVILRYCWRREVGETRTPSVPDEFEAKRTYWYLVCGISPVSVAETVTGLVPDPG